MRELGFEPLEPFKDVRTPRHLDLRIWFRELHIHRSTGEEIPLQEFIDGGVRWWDGLYAGDPRTSGNGIYPG